MLGYGWVGLTFQLEGKTDNVIVCEAVEEMDMKMNEFINEFKKHYKHRTNLFSLSHRHSMNVLM